MRRVPTPPNPNKTVTSIVGTVMGNVAPSKNLAMKNVNTPSAVFATIRLNIFTTRKNPIIKTTPKIGIRIFEFVTA